jgi:hypothetical protein
MGSDPCQPLRDQIDGLESMIDGLQAELQTAPPGMKPALIRMIVDARREIGDRRSALRACEQANPRPPPSENVVLTTATCPVCTTEQARIWQHVATAQLGVDAVDVEGHWIGGFPAERFGALNNWYPLAVEKRVLCGTLSRFGFYDGLGAEADWNNFIIPSPAFRHLLEDAKIHGTSDEWHNCNGIHDCMEAEITPDESYYENVFNSRVLNQSFIQGQQVGTYGPWVRERVHDNRPEIHPSEMYWWRGELPGRGFTYTLMMVQDDSNRFDREGDFDFGAPWDDPPSGWRPWSANPRTNRFRIAFELNPTGPPLTFRIRHLESLRVQERWGDATPGAEHALEYNGRVVLRVEELLPNEGHLGVQFGSVCRNAADTRLQGYIVLTATVGIGDRGGEGYQTLRVEVVRPPFIDDLFRGDWPVLAAEEPQRRRLTVHTRARPETLRRVEVNGQPRLAGDVEVQVGRRSELAGPDADVAIDRAELVSATERRRLPHEAISRAAGPRAQRAVVSDVALIDQTNLEVTLDSGDVVPVNLPALAIVPRITQEAPRQTASRPAAWNALAAAAGARVTNVPPPVPVVRARRWQLEAAPEYAAVRAGRPSAEDDSPFVEALNKVVRSGDAGRIDQLFGAARPVRVDWTFQAVNLASGQPVPVHEGPGAPPNAVQVEVTPGTSLASALSVVFPQGPAGAVFELTATARMRDTFGVEGEARHRLWSHMLTHDDARQLAESMIPAAASLAGLAPADLVAAVDMGGPVIDGVNDEPRVPSLRSSRATMVRLAAIAASEDRRITVDELSGLIRAAAAFGDAP